MKFPKISFGEEWNNLKKFENLSDFERSIVFYAENEASMNHFRTLIFELTERMNFQICYITSVKNDQILSSKNKNILSFYIGEGAARTKFFLTLRAKILVMDMPDLDRYHIKRSKAYPIHYIYLFHSMFSIHSYLRKGALDNYDTIFCVGPHHVNELRTTEKLYGLKPKTIVNYGFGRLDTLLQEKEKFAKPDSNLKDLILITPSYGDENLLEKCGIELIDTLLKSDFRVLLRPHFRTLRDSKELIDSIKNKFEKNPSFIFEDGVIPPEYFHNSICMISDWSGISMEYAFTFERSVIFIDVPKKILNPDADDLPLEPIEISIRKKIGHIVSTNNIREIQNIINNLNNNTEDFKKQLKLIRQNTVFNISTSSKIGANYIEKLIQNDS
jgi:YidC/Oxa1 family membrane protein insertase